MRILALDVGERRIGVAVSDALNIIAQGLETIERKGEENILNRIKGLLEEYDIGKIVIGMPFNMDGTKGASAESIERFISLLKKEITVDIETVDERLTTAQGERMLIDADVSRKKRRSSLDKIAAQLILQAYLDSHEQKNRP